MAAPGIPNLNTLRTSRGGAGLRGLRGRGRNPGESSGGPETESEKAAARDRIIQQTDNDASSSRMSAVALGYLTDPYARSFTQGQVAKRYPIINRGTYVRTTAIDRLVNAFLSTDPSTQKQIISLGAGSDTRFFRLPETDPRPLYHEIDFASNTSSKIAAIQHSPALQSRIGPFSINSTNTTLQSTNYNIHALDLRTLPTSPSNTLTINPQLPTLIISECCLCYLSPPETSTILSVLLTSLLTPSTPAALILYEPIRPHDPFGQTMISNLGSREIHLSTLKRFHSLAAQRLRLKAVGFVDGQGARDVEGLYYGRDEEAWIEPEERERVERLEWLDEVEEWKLLARHYCVAWGWRGEVFSLAWGNIRGEWTEDERGDEEVG
ncbi:hypothetical protein MBLNU457_2368t1 [Dothideomycetes sp. NU457]